MKRIVLAGLTAACVLAAPMVANSGSHAAAEKEIKARQGVMQLYSFHLGNIAAMIKGEAEYDAKKAQALADNLVALVKMDTSAMWPEGSDAEANPGKTDALKVAWTSYPAIIEEQKKLISAAEAMAKTAGDGVDALKASIGGVGATCKSCHKVYRKP